MVMMGPRGVTRGETGRVVWLWNCHLRGDISPGGIPRGKTLPWLPITMGVPSLPPSLGCNDLLVVDVVAIGNGVVFGPRILLIGGQPRIVMGMIRWAGPVGLWVWSHSVPRGHHVHVRGRIHVRWV